MLKPLLLLVCVGAGTIGGVFFAFSTFVMRALAQLPPNDAVAAMQRINAAVLNRLFLGVFMGTALLSAACVAEAFFPWSGTRSPWLLAAGMLYLAGSFLVTAACNVPKNKRLASFEAGSAQAAAYWPVYLQEWIMWNHVRTAASLASSACAALALAA